MNTTTMADVDSGSTSLSSVSSRVVPVLDEEAISEYQQQQQQLPQRVSGLSSSPSWSDVEISGDPIRNINSEENIQMQPLSKLENSEQRQNPDDFLPITKSRTGNTFTVAFHSLCSGIGIQTLLLPVAFISLGWFWGSLCLSLVFAWQLYTTWLLVHLHEPIPGTRYSRFVVLSFVAFGPKLGKFLAIFPSMYLSGATCSLIVINGGATMEFLYSLVCGDDAAICHAKRLSGVEWFLLFVCVSIFLSSLFPSLNSLARFSLIGSLAAVVYTTMFWTVSVSSSRQGGGHVTHELSKASSSSKATRMRDIINAVGIISIAFRGHNVVLEIQGTLPADPQHPHERRMWRGVIASYVVIALCMFPLAIGGHWAYGNMMPSGGIVDAYFLGFHHNNTKKSMIVATYLIMLIHLISIFQIFAMPVFDNLERIYVSKKKKASPRWLQFIIRILFGGYTYFMSTAFPFLGSLSPFFGSLTLPLTLAYPCFMWNSIKKPKPMGLIWSLNFGLGSFGILMCVFLVTASLWYLIADGLDANFFNPR